MKVTNIEIVKMPITEFSRGRIEKIGDKDTFELIIHCYPEDYYAWNWTKADLIDFRDAIDWMVKNT